LLLRYSRLVAFAVVVVVGLLFVLLVAATGDEHE
jgi:hypothetical protein